MRTGLAICIVLGLAVGCGSKDARPTREACTQVADHMADLMLAHFVEHPDELWDLVASADAPDVPQGTTRETFPSFLASPEGKTWLLKRHGDLRTGTLDGVDGCTKNATRSQVKCLLAAKSRDDVEACDRARTR
jgi:hypothetical protein